VNIIPLHCFNSYALSILKGDVIGAVRETDAIHFDPLGMPVAQRLMRLM
jgi:hypothetical protein